MSQEQLQAIIQQLKANPLLEQPEIEAVRAGFEQMASLFPVPADVKCEPVTAGTVEAEWVTAPGAASDRVILHLHGGGYVIGSINTHRALAAGLSRAAKARVLLIDYRLAPEHPHPAAVEDATAAYRWLLAQGLSPKRIADRRRLGGRRSDDRHAGGAARRRKTLPAAGVCLSPWVDLEGIGDSMTTRAAARSDGAEGRPRAARDALPRRQHPRTPLAAPLYADLSGLPPLLIQVGTARRCSTTPRGSPSARARPASKSPTSPWEGMIHVWQLFASMLDEGQQAIERIGAVREKQDELRNGYRLRAAGDDPLVVFPVAP